MYNSALHLVDTVSELTCINDIIIFSEFVLFVATLPRTTDEPASTGHPRGMATSKDLLLSLRIKFKKNI